MGRTMIDIIADWLISHTEGRAPDYVIGHPAAPYMRRWWLIPRNRVFNIYLHQILRDDDDRALHDHPGASLSILLRGGYVEVLPAHPGMWPWNRTTLRRWRKAGDIIFRRAAEPHRLEIESPGSSGCWSLFLMGPRLREWGFWCETWRPWYEFVDPHNPGRPGRGCN